MSRKVLYLLGPTCSGKTSIAEVLKEKYGYGTIKSTMTRESRGDNDKNIFLNKTLFENLIKRGKFLEYAMYSNDYYGTLRESVLDGFGDNNILSVKVIEVTGLMQILKSGFHESSGIDFFIVYINPQFEGYDNHVKTRDDWERRSEEDKHLYFTFLKSIRNIVSKKKYKVIVNAGSLNKVISDINLLCISHDRSYVPLRTMLSIPESVEINNKYDLTCIYSVTLIDSNHSTSTKNFYLNSGTHFNAIKYMSEVFDGKDIHYKDDEYIAINLESHGVLAVICKERGVRYIQ